MKKERYVIGQCFNTKDWWVYDNDVDRYVCSDTKENCERYVNEHNNRLFCKGEK